MKSLIAREKAEMQLIKQIKNNYTFDEIMLILGLSKTLSVDQVLNLNNTTCDLLLTIASNEKLIGLVMYGNLEYVY